MERTVLACHQEKLFKIILSFPENRCCADCGSLNPDWISFNFGVFICYKCSGNHRSFGMHITRVKSATLDTWSLRQVYVIGCLDNNQSNAYWEANFPPGFTKPTYDSTPNELSSFAKRKYVEKAFIIEGKESPAEELLTNPMIMEEQTEEESRDEFFQRKLEDFKMVLKSKVNACSPDLSKKGVTPLQVRSCRKAGTQFHPAANTFAAIPGEFEDSPSKKNVRALVSPFSTTIHAKKDGTDRILFPKKVAFKDTITCSSAELPLFQGLNIKTQTSIAEEVELNRRSPAKKKLMRLHTQEVPSTYFPDSQNFYPSSTVATSKNTIGIIASKSRIISQLDEVNIFEQSRRATPRGSLEREIELQDMSHSARSKRSSRKSSRRSLLPDECSINDELENLEISKSESSIRTRNSINLKFSDAEPAQHLKRPGEAFEVPKCLSVQDLPQPKLKRGEHCSRYTVLFSCFLLHLVMGYIYSWGSISPYTASFVMDEYQDEKYIEHTSLNMMIFLGVSMGFCLCEKLGNALGMRLLVIMSFLGLSSGLLVCSFAQDVILYSGFLTIVPGFFIGILYEIPFFCASQYYGSSQIFLRSFFYLANGIGAFGYSYLSYYYLSLTDIKGELLSSEHEASNFYSSDVVSHVPDLLRLTSYAVLAISLIAGVLLQPRASFIIRDWRDRDEGLLGTSKRPSFSRKLRRKATSVLNQGLKEALGSSSTKSLFSLMMVFPVLGTYLLYSYKCIGFAKNFSDAEMALAGGIGMIMLNVGKMIGVIIHPRFEFRSMCKNAIICQAIAGVALYISGQFINLPFIGLFIVIMLLDGLMFSLIIEEIRFVHPDDVEDSMVALMILGYAIANFMSFMIVKSLSLLALMNEAILVLTLSLCFAHQISKKYSRNVLNDDSELIAMLLDV